MAPAQPVLERESGQESAAEEAWLADSRQARTTVEESAALRNPAADLSWRP